MLKQKNKLLIILIAGDIFLTNLCFASTLPILSNVDNTVIATGKSTVNLPQTQGVVVLGVSSTNSDPKLAQESVRIKSDKLLSVIRKLQPINIATTSIAVNPVWSYKDNTSKITGYTANYSLTITSSINQIGGIIDRAIDNGADNIGSPIFSASDKSRESANLMAIKLATQDAKTKAEASLSALNIKGGKVRQILIQTPVNSLYPVEKVTTMNASNENVSTPIVAGYDAVNAEVMIVMSYLK